MTTYLAIALIALLAGALKTLVLSKAVTRSTLNSAFAILALALIAQNASEFATAIVLNYNPENVQLYFYLALSCLFVFPVALLHFVATVTQHRLGRIATRLAGVSCLLLIGMLFSGHLVSGYQLTSYSIISTPGKYYALFQLYGLLSMLTPILFLLQCRNSRDQKIARRARVTLSAIGIICLVGVGVVVLRVLGFNSTTALSLPMATTAFLWVLMLDERDEFISLQIKWRVLWKLARTMRSLELSQWSDCVERLLVEESLKSKQYNQSAAAKLIKSTQPTFYRKVVKYGLGAHAKTTASK